MRFLFMAALIAACTHLPHVEPRARTPDVAERAIVTLDVTCGNLKRWGSGVVISDRHILTAAHVVACPLIPNVIASFSDGRRFRVVVTRDAAAFEDGTDIARLESGSAENFGLNITPPEIGHFVAGDALVAMTIGKVKPVGMMFGSDVVRGMTTIHGDSGAGVYDTYGLLVGLVSRGAADGSYTRIVLVTSSWLKGT